MSMIENQISRLNEIREELDCDIINWRQDWSKEIKDAISTIQDLSAKLAAANMERSSAYYNGRWIPCVERMPEDMKEVLITEEYDGYNEHHHYRQCAVSFVYNGLWSTRGGENYTATAWMPLPEPYRKEE